MAAEPTEPAALAAASLLAAGAVNEQSGQTRTRAWAGHAQLAGLVQRAAADHDVEAVLDKVTARPQDPETVGALAQVLTALASENSAFGGELARLVRQAEHDPAIGWLATTITGHARVGKVVTIGHAGHVHVHLPPQSPPTVLDQLPPARPGVVVSNLPARNRVFTGRSELLARLNQQLSASTLGAVAVTALPMDSPAVTAAPNADAPPQVLHGLGGVGKTQLALEYAHRHQGDYAIRWWVAAEQPAAIPAHLLALARRLGIPEQSDQSETIAVLLDELGRRGGWLLVFDNAEDPHNLRPYWPSTEHGGHLLVTSRNPNWQPLAAPIPVDVLPRRDAIAFLQRRAGLNEPNADRLAEALGDLPLALDQAVAYLEQTHIPSDEYLELLATRSRELFALGRAATSEQTIATIWAVSLQRVHSEAPAAEGLLRLCAFLAPDDIPRATLYDYPEVLPEPLASAVRDQLAFHQALAALGRFSLATVTDDAVSVHRLVQAVIRHQLSTDEQEQWARVAVTLVLAAFPNEPWDVNAWPTAARLLPHALAAGEHEERLLVDLQAAAAVLGQAAMYLWGRAEHTLAVRLLERALTICETHLDPDHLTTAQSLNNLAVVLHAHGDLDRARTLQERALAIRKARLGPDHPDTAQSLNNLALVLRDQGDLDGARMLYERALTIREARVGPDHPTTAHNLTNLAVVLRDQGDLSRSYALHERALAIFEAHLGADHPTTGESLSYLAMVVARQGDLDRARTLLERALTVFEARLGPNHPDTAWSLHELAVVLRDQGDLARARALHERALAIYRTRFGSDHPDTARSLSNLAVVLADQGNLRDARALLGRAQAIYEARLGADHPNTALSLSNLANVLYGQGDLDAARRLYQRALGIYEGRLGADHPDTVRSREALAAVVAELDNQP